jgi:2-amino-4-hydroxy-6-hydroxymethyldihydropteridine diphosphokinase
LSRVFLGIGSNRQAPRHVGLALDGLADRYGKLELSSVYESEAVGFAGDNFLNLVVALNTRDPVGSLSDWLKGLENRHGRRRDCRACPLALDVDILTYDALVGEFAGVRLPRPELLKNAFVLQPLAEIAGDDSHPVTGRTYSDLWKAYRGRQKLWKVPFTWRGQLISPR